MSSCLVAVFFEIMHEWRASSADLSVVADAIVNDISLEALIGSVFGEESD